VEIFLARVQDGRREGRLIDSVGIALALETDPVVLVEGIQRESLCWQRGEEVAGVDLDGWLIGSNDKLSATERVSECRDMTRGRSRLTRLTVSSGSSSVRGEDKGMVDAVDAIVNDLIDGRAEELRRGEVKGGALDRGDVAQRNQPSIDRKETIARQMKKL
jgi:hypothetical protein